MLPFHRVILLWLGIKINIDMIRNLFLTLEDIADSTAKTRAVQQRFLGSLAKIVLDNMIALDYLLVEQGDICPMVNTTYCI